MTAAVAFEFFGAGVQVLYGAEGLSLVRIRAYLQSEIDEFMDGITGCDLQEDEGEGADPFLRVLFGVFNTAGMDRYPLRTIERAIGEEYMFQRKLDVFGLDHASEVRYFPIIEGYFAAKIFSKIGCHTVQFS